MLIVHLVAACPFARVFVLCLLASRFYSCSYLFLPFLIPAPSSFLLVLLLTAFSRVSWIFQRRLPWATPTRERATRCFPVLSLPLRSSLFFVFLSVFSLGLTRFYMPLHYCFLDNIPCNPPCKDDVISQGRLYSLLCSSLPFSFSLITISIGFLTHTLSGLNKARKTRACKTHEPTVLYCCFGNGRKTASSFIHTTVTFSMQCVLLWQLFCRDNRDFEPANINRHTQTFTSTKDYIRLELTFEINTNCVHVKRLFSLRKYVPLYVCISCYGLRILVLYISPQTKN